jgi:pyruvate dehydrogenase E2 component (dihydrolipoamide acetyltransferase)
MNFPCVNFESQVPGVNSSWQKDFIRQYSNVDISVAVQTPTGLLTPIIKDSDKKGLASISSDVKALANKVLERSCLLHHAC